MTAEGWKQLIANAVQKKGEGLDHLAQLLEELDETMQRLRDMGFGCTGMGLLESVKEIESAMQHQRPINEK